MKNEVIRAVEILMMHRNLEGLIHIDPYKNQIHVDGERFDIQDVPGELQEVYYPKSRYYPWRYFKNYQGAEFMCLTEKRLPGQIGRPKVAFSAN